MNAKRNLLENLDLLSDLEIESHLDRILYERFKPGLDFTEFRQFLARESWDCRQKTGKYMFITRSTVLGRMHEIKTKMYEHQQIDEFVGGLSEEQKKKLLRLLLENPNVDIFEVTCQLYIDCDEDEGVEGVPF